jgi:type IV pilus assembly protein PilB
MPNIGERIITILKETERISKADVDKVLAAYSRDNSVQLKDVLVKMGLITEKELLWVLSRELSMPFINLARLKVSPELGRLIPEKIARKHTAAPVSKIGNALTLAMADPFNIIAIDDIAITTRHRICPVLATQKEIEDLLNRLYAREADNMTSIAEMIGSSEDIEFIRAEDDIATVHSEGEGAEAPVVRVVDLLIRQALKRRASDIHIEPYERAVRVRYRIDGNLEEVLTIPKKSQNGVLARLKIMSRLDITENRVPQDGRFKVKISDREVDFRVSVLPVNFGSKMVMRILDRGSLQVGLDHLGFLPDSLRNIKEAITKPFGMILVTGPTGSGKSTTLYSILNQLNSPDKNIITIEDPIEYQVKGVTQIQARPEIGMDFASGLRAILRQSPDIVMVGEIRDFETVDIAIKASLTGQLVLSTLHTNDSAGAMTRLMDMGVEPFLISSSVVLVAAQRLCRKVCAHCREKIDIPGEVFERMGIDLDAISPDPAKRVFLRGKGCAKCNKTGYLGRMGVLETMPVDEGIRDLVVKRASSYEIKDYALKKGMVTLREDALRKFALGMTTLDEVIRVTSEDE